MTEFIKSSIRSSFLLWISVIKLMIPIAISVKLLDEVGGIHFIGTLLEPIMISVGLPGIMGLVWAVTMFTNLWTGALLFVTLIGNVEVTSAQVTILGIMMLISHGLPLEIRMVQKCGVSAIFSLILRLSGSLILAYLFNFAFNTFNLLNEPALVMIGEASSLQESFSSWCVSQLKSYILVYFMLVGLVLTLDLLKKFNLVHKLGKILSPYFSLIGVSKTVLL
ncbi:hypothetical protein [Vibrio coralliilyticus]|uniref:hypothetical protein n=1 Tax=Vibrio coralliilyticus TaxID=190893 RepID=UPI00301E55F6